MNYELYIRLTDVSLSISNQQIVIERSTQLNEQVIAFAPIRPHDVSPRFFLKITTDSDVLLSTSYTFVFFSLIAMNVRIAC